MPITYSPVIAWLAAALLLFVTVFALLAARRLPHLTTGWLWYLGTLVPVIGLVSVGEQARADRYTYFPLIGIFIMIAWSISAPRTLTGIAAISAGAAAIVMALSIQTWRQLGWWRNSETLLEHTLSIVGPHPTLYLTYAEALSDKNEHERAIDLYMKALALRPNWSRVMNYMGTSLLRLGRTSEAIAYYRAAINADPSNWLAYYNLGSTLGRQGRLSEGEQLLRESLRLRPDYMPARQNLNNTLILQGKPQE